MNSGSTRVETDGPPPVIIIGTANTFIATITVIRHDQKPGQAANLV
jgi:hypothetical protein